MHADTTQGELVHVLQSLSASRCICIKASWDQALDAETICLHTYIVGCLLIAVQLSTQEQTSQVPHNELQDLD